VLQCVAVCCSVLQCVAVCCSVHIHTHKHILMKSYPNSTCDAMYYALCCSVLQCAVVCCSVLHCVAVCCSVVQYVAVCCSVGCSNNRDPQICIKTRFIVLFEWIFCILVAIECPQYRVLLPPCTIAGGWRWSA